MNIHTTHPLQWNQAMTLLKVMKDNPKEANTRLMLAVGFYTGLRISDILSLQWHHLEEKEIVLNEKKTNKLRKMQIAPQLRRIIEETKELTKGPFKQEDYIFQIQKIVRTKYPISVVAANKRIKKTFEKYGIVSSNPSSHTLRKTFALRIFEVYNRCDDALILLSHILNHTNTTVTRKYIGLTERRIKDAYLAMASGKAVFE